MVVLVCGDRYWDQRGVIEHTLSALHLRTPITKLTHGACRGADALAGAVAKHLGIPVQDYPAKWTRHGKAAGPIRNRLMFREEKPDLVIAFHDSLLHSTGTLDMVEYAIRFVEVWQVRSDGSREVLTSAPPRR